MYAEHGSGEKELYDLNHRSFRATTSRHDDPAYVSIKAQLATRLQELQTCAGPSCRTNP